MHLNLHFTDKINHCCLLIYVLTVLFSDPGLTGVILSFSMVSAHRLNEILACEKILMVSFTGNPVADAE